MLTRCAGLPVQLPLQSVPLRVAFITAVASCVLAAGTILEGFPLWAIALAVLLPWGPLFAFESIWSYQHYGFYALFMVTTVLQLGHLGEHTAQVTQLLISGGDLDRSHGVFGQLDFETVHFVWDSGVWLSTCLLLYRFSGSRWLAIAFLASSLHEVEHIYLYWLFMAHEDFYMGGCLAGIMGRGGVIGSPLYRPYLHFMYNFLVAVPMVIALGVWEPRSRARTR